MNMHVVETRDTWDIRPRELHGPYQTIGEADAQAQRIQHHDRAGRFTVAVLNIRAGEDWNATDYATETEWRHTYSDEDRFMLATSGEHHTDYMNGLNLHGEMGA